MAYESYCAACTYLGEKSDYTGKYYCEKKGEEHYATDPKCYSFCEAYSRSNSARSNMMDNSRNHASSGCYLTTIMCHLLGFEDNNYYLNTLRRFRDNVMQTNPNYLPLLLKYDVVGPVISEKLANDKDGKQIAEAFFNNYIGKAVMAIEENKNEVAINIYTAMTQALAEKYQVMIPVLEVDTKNINPKSLGHGYARTLKQQQ